MKKFIYLGFAGLLGLASCSDDAFVGDQSALGQSGNGEIQFTSKAPNMTRALFQGADAAAKLGNNFIVAGYKGNTKSVVGGTVTGDMVFDHYAVVWDKNTAGTTASNSSDWEYVGKDFSLWNTTKPTTGTPKQTIKYWDYSTAQHDFIAFSTSDFSGTINKTGIAASQLYISQVTPTTATNSTGGAYKVGGTVEQLKKVYVADLATVDNKHYGEEVKLSFHNLTSKVRIGIYETVPGYAIKDVKFYSDGTTNPYTMTDHTGWTAGDVIAADNIYIEDDSKYYLCIKGKDKYVAAKTYKQIVENTSATNANATLYSSTNSINTNGTYTVYFPTTNANLGEAGHLESDLNKAHVAFSAETNGSIPRLEFGAALKYANNRTSLTTEDAETRYLGMTSNEATYVTTTPEKDYKDVLPNEEAAALTLRVNYTLVSEDGSKEMIKVYGAKAVVPAIYCNWRSNYAYTYLFKISDNTNGATSFVPNTDEGLFPITFDAVVMNYEDGLQETVTTVATPSITTYSTDPTVQPTANDEYLTNKDIYVQVVTSAGTIATDLGTSGKSIAYNVTLASGFESTPISEATIMDALQMRVSDSPITGRNGIILTPITIDNAVTLIPGVDTGKATNVSAGTTAKFSTGSTAGAKIAYVYDFTPVSPAPGVTYIYTAIVGDGSTVAAENEYYEDPNGEDVVASATTLTNGKTYYKKYANNGRSYAVKVVKVKGA